MLEYQEYEKFISEATKEGAVLIKNKELELENSELKHQLRIWTFCYFLTFLVMVTLSIILFLSYGRL